ncbi:MAG: Wzz/FepE/Etk N-terminal domain-containing protein [Spirochaetales bacterium]
MDYKDQPESKTPAQPGTNPTKPAASPASTSPMQATPPTAAGGTPYVPAGGTPVYPYPMGVVPGPGYSGYDGEEINLIDLFIVLIKRRRLILGFPLLVALVTGIYLFVLPAFGVLSFQTYSLQAVVASVQIPPALREQVGMDIPGLTVAYGQEFNTVIDAVVKNKLKTDNLPLDPTDLRLRTYVAKSFIGKDYKVKAEKEGIRFEVKAREKEAAKAFLADMLNRVDSRLRKQIAERSKVIYESMEELWKEVSQTLVLSDTVKVLIASSKVYKEGTLPVLVSVAEPEVFLEPQRRSTTFVVAVVASFFLAIFLAFVVEYVHNIKKDPETLSKIQAAWKGKE